MTPSDTGIELATVASCAARDDIGRHTDALAAPDGRPSLSLVLYGLSTSAFHDLDTEMEGLLPTIDAGSSESAPLSDGEFERRPSRSWVSPGESTHSCGT